MRPRALVPFASDERLAVFAAGGDPAAFEALYDRHRRGIYALCSRLLRRREDAEDALQQTFLSAYRALRRDRAPRRVRAWLYTIARNQCLAVLKASTSQAASEAVDDLVDEASRGRLEQREELRRVLDDLSRLPEQQQTALVLSELRPFTQAEVAEVLGCTRSEVKSLVFRARSALAADRAARDTACEDIRAQLGTLKRGALRRRELRRHLSRCEGCREYRDALRREHKAIGAIAAIEVAPEVKERVLEATVAAGGIGAAGPVVGFLAALGAKGAALVAATAVLGIATGGAILTERGGAPKPPAARPAAAAGTASARPGSGRAQIAGGPRARRESARRARQVHAKAAGSRRSHRARVATGVSSAPPAGQEAPPSSSSPTAPAPLTSALPTGSAPQLPAGDTSGLPTSTDTATSTTPALPQMPSAGTPVPTVPSPLPAAPALP